LGIISRMETAFVIALVLSINVLNLHRISIEWNDASSSKYRHTYRRYSSGFTSEGALTPSPSDTTTASVVDLRYYYC
jgi:hypothetical protein